LYLRFEKLEIQLRRRGHRRMRLFGCKPNRHQDPGPDCQKQNSSPVENLCQIHDSSTVKNRRYWTYWPGAALRVISMAMISSCKAKHLQSQYY
jgi:hypothetical protein